MNIEMYGSCVIPKVLAFVVFIGACSSVRPSFDDGRQTPGVAPAEGVLVRGEPAPASSPAELRVVRSFVPLDVSALPLPDDICALRSCFDAGTLVERAVDIESCEAGDHSVCWELAADERWTLRIRAGIYAWSCRRGSARACGYLGIMLTDEDQGDHLPLIRMACAADHAQSCGWLIEHQGAGAVTTAHAHRVYEEGCAAEDWYGCGALGRLQWSGVGRTVDKSAARESLRVACSDAHFRDPAVCAAYELLRLGSSDAREAAAAREAILEDCDQTLAGIGACAESSAAALVELLIGTGRRAEATPLIHTRCADACTAPEECSAQTAELMRHICGLSGDVPPAAVRREVLVDLLLAH